MAQTISIPDGYAGATEGGDYVITEKVFGNEGKSGIPESTEISNGYASGISTLKNTDI